MISRIRGTLLRREGTAIEILTAGGVAYQIDVPLFVAERLPREGTEIELRTCQVVRDDALLLFGFLEEFERVVFTRLLATAGIGPRLALAMLSNLRPDRLVSAVLDRDVDMLRQVPGVGKKTAERLVLELADRMEDLVGTVTGPVAGGAKEGVAALVALGFAVSEANNAVRAVIDEQGELHGAELVKAALARLSR